MEWINENLPWLIAAGGVLVPMVVVFGVKIAEKGAENAATKVIRGLYAHGDDEVDQVIEVNMLLLARKIPDEITHKHQWIRKIAGGKVWLARLLAAGLRGIDKAATQANIPKK